MDPILEIELKSLDWAQALPRLRADMPGMRALWDAIEDTTELQELQDEIAEQADRADRSEGHVIELRDRLEYMLDLTRLLSEMTEPDRGSVATVLREVERAYAYACAQAGR